MTRSKALNRAVRKYQNWLAVGHKEVTYHNHFFLQLGICAALFIALFGMRHLQVEPVQSALAGLRSVATTETEIGRSIGKLAFVGNFVPESVMVFWNAQDKTLTAPLENSSLLLETEDCAWFEGDGALLAGGEGKVQEVEQLKDGGFGLTIAYDNGLVSVIEPLQGVRVAADERVHAGQNIGIPMQAGDAMQVKVAVTDGSNYVKVETWLS